MSGSKRNLPLVMACLFATTCTSAMAGSQSLLDPYSDIQAPKGKSAARANTADAATGRPAEPVTQTYVTMSAPEGKSNGSGGHKLSVPKISVPKVSMPKIAMPKIGGNKKGDDARVKTAKSDSSSNSGNGVISNAGSKVKDAGSNFVSGTKAASAKMVDGTKAAGTKVVDGTKAASAKVVNGGKAVGEKIADGTQKMRDGIASGAKAIGSGLKSTGEKMKDGTAAIGGKVASIGHHSSKSSTATASSGASNTVASNSGSQGLMSKTFGKLKFFGKHADSAPATASSTSSITK